MCVVGSSQIIVCPVKYLIVCMTQKCLPPRLFLSTQVILSAPSQIVILSAPSQIVILSAPSQIVILCAPSQNNSDYKSNDCGLIQRCLLFNSLLVSFHQNHPRFPRE